MDPKDVALDPLDRLRDVIKPRGAVPMSRSHFLALVKTGVAPQPVRCGKITAWRRSEIAKFLAERFK